MAAPLAVGELDVRGANGERSGGEGNDAGDDDEQGERDVAQAAAALAGCDVVESVHAELYFTFDASSGAAGFGQLASVRDGRTAVAGLTLSQGYSGGSSRRTCFGSMTGRIAITAIWRMPAAT